MADGTSPLESHEAIADALIRLASHNDHAARTLERLETHVLELRSRVEGHLVHRRKNPSPKVRELHVRAISAMGGGCPFCDASLFNDAGDFTGQIHHHDKASDAREDAVMPTCGPCNQRFSFQPAPRAVIDAYHLRRARQSGPLFGARKRGSR